MSLYIIILMVSLYYAYRDISWIIAMVSIYNALHCRWSATISLEATSELPSHVASLHGALILQPILRHSVALPAWKLSWVCWKMVPIPKRIARISFGKPWTGHHGSSHAPGSSTTGTLGSIARDHILVGGWPTPLKNMSIGMMTSPWENKSHVPNHQPDD